LEIIAAFIDRASDRIGRAVAWFSLVMVLLMAAIVALRYLFQFGSVAMQESVMYVNALIFTLGAAYTLKEQRHVRVDIFYGRFKPRQQALVDLIGSCLLLLPCACFIIYASWDYVSVSWRIRESSAERSGLPWVYLLKASIILLAVLLIIQGISEALKAWIRVQLNESDVVDTNESESP